MAAKKKTGGRKLTVKQRKLAKHYAATGNQTQAAKLAGYSKKSAHVIGHEMLKKPEIKRAVHEALEESLAKAQLKSDHVIEQLRRIAFSDISEIYRDDGILKHPHEMSDEAKVSIAGIETSEILGPFGVKLGEKKKLKIADKTKALELLGKSFGIFKDVVDNNIKGEIVTGSPEEMDAAYERARKKV